MSTSDHPTREQILRAAEPLFAEHGFAGLTMRDIAAAAGVHLGQLPYHFGTKEALYRAIWEHWISQVEARALLTEMQPGAHASHAAQLRGVVKAFFDGPCRMMRDPRGKHFVAERPCL
ncbi:TetR/AcrR family transcriptional regulator [Novosphingobium flavum]|uniref:TetR/AcrR family transcriptional regulator n=1 Tax=Novosphingobium flavum TaxID=1778672 RepID=A0A7X1FT82_9SPHN|nr:TetR/AcrR family transcriptional regulator [Novosphingobium flavum]MBC2666530.1 TetR/AcrR family transcriptional regulator [Novosphingobium flavum]